jgi:hypothetical protein
MLKDMNKSQFHAETHYSAELRRALQDRALQDLLQQEVGSFSISYMFINEYINYINLRESNPKYSPIIESARSFKFNKIFALIKKISGKKSKDQIDFLFISRDRQVKIKVASGYLTGDYIFYSVIDDLIRKNAEYKIHMYVLDDSYAKYSYSTLADVARTINIALKISFKWTLLKKGIIERLKAADCNNVISVASYFFHIRILMRLALMGYSMASMLSTMRPKVIVSNDDCMYTRPLNNNSKIVVLQSARIANYVEECKGFIFQDRNLKPDYFLSSGRIFSKIKEKYNEAENVLITGLPRYDVLANASDIYSKNEFLKLYKINPKNKVILWTTQCHALSKEENTANYQTVFGAMKDLEGVTLIIKQHPAEGESYTEIIRNYIEDCQVDCLITPKNSDTYEQLSICDLVIAKTSTTVIEAVALNKPIIILNLSGVPDSVEYVREGIALGIYAKHNLRDGIKKLLSDDSELASNRAKYIENYLYKIDGLATDRVVRLLIELAASQAN